MLPIVDTPVIQYVVEEAVASGITDILMIIGKGKRAIEEHFDRNFELESELSGKGKEEELKTIKRLSRLANIHFVWQKELKGLGDAISYARDHTAGEPFAMLLGDTIVDSKQPVTKQLIGVYNKYHKAVVALEEVERSKVSRYGIISGKEIKKNIYKIKDLVEKPKVEEAPSKLAIAGRYIFTSEIFDYIDKTPPGKNNEIQLTDSMKMLAKSCGMYGLKFDGRRYDIGSKVDFVKTNVTFALKRAELREEITSFIKKLSKEL